MDNISVFASLVLLGLFLITSPVEGFVRDRRGYHYNIDLSDQEVQSSPLSWRGLTKGIMDAEMKTEDNREEAYDGDYLFKASENDVLHRSMNRKGNGDGATRPNYPTKKEPEGDYEILAGPDAKTTQSSDTTNGGKRADGFAEKDGVMTDGYADNEMDINADPETFLRVLPLSSKL